MATAEQKLALLPRAQEGRCSFGELIKRLVGAEHWSALLEHSHHYPGVPLGLETSTELYFDPRWWAAMQACSPLLDAWNADDLIAEGRCRDPLAPHQKIAAPRVGWTLVVYDFERSTISDPTATRDNPAKIYDLHFTRHAAELTGAAVWAVPEAERLTGAGGIFKSKTDFAKAIVKAPENVKADKPVKYKHIYNKLEAWGVWPINSDK